MPSDAPAPLPATSGPVRLDIVVEGPTGAGKTTHLRALASAVAPSSAAATSWLSVVDPADSTATMLCDHLTVDVPADDDAGLPAVGLHLWATGGAAEQAITRRVLRGRADAVIFVAHGVRTRAAADNAAWDELTLALALPPPPAPVAVPARGSSGVRLALGASDARTPLPVAVTPGRTTPPVMSVVPGRTTPPVMSVTPGRTTPPVMSVASAPMPPGRTTPPVATPGRTTPAVATPGRTTPAVATPGRTPPASPALAPVLALPVAVVVAGVGAEATAAASAVRAAVPDVAVWTPPPAGGPAAALVDAVVDVAAKVLARRVASGRLGDGGVDAQLVGRLRSVLRAGPGPGEDRRP